MTPKVILPLDVLAYIADSLVDEDDWDETTLQRLSQTCQSMVYPCRRHLFATLVLSSLGTSRLDHFSNLLQKNPRIASYVKSLQYEFHPIVISDQEHHILEVLHKESSLRSIELLSHRKDWNTFPAETTRPLLESLIQSPSITHLAFSSFSNFPASILSLCDRLVDLELHQVTLVGPHGVQPTATRTKVPMPLSLTAEEESYGALGALMARDGPNEDPIVDFSHLQEGSFEVQSVNDLHTICKLLQTTTQMRSIELEVNDSVPLVGIGASLAVGAHRTLRSASLNFEVEGDDHDPLCGLDLALRKLAGDNVLETLNVDVFVDVNLGCRTDSEDWTDLDKVLTESGAFPNLRKVSISLNWTFTGRGLFDFDYVLGKLKEDRFPLLLETASIDFDFSEEHDWDSI